MAYSRIKDKSVNVIDVPALGLSRQKPIENNSSYNVKCHILKKSSMF